MLSAFVNALTLVALSVWILYEAVLRLRAPEPVHETIMMLVAALGLAMNGGIMLALRRPAATISMCAAPSCTCWATRWLDRDYRGRDGDPLHGWVQVDPILSI